MTYLYAGLRVYPKVPVECPTSQPIGTRAQVGIDTGPRQHHAASENQSSRIGLRRRIVGNLAEALAEALYEHCRRQPHVRGSHGSRLPLTWAKTAVGHRLEVTPEGLHGRPN